MAKIMYVKDDGTQTVLKENLSECLTIIALRYVTKGDLCSALQEKGYTDTLKTADKVLAAVPDLGAQLECRTDYEVDCIDEAIETAHIKGLISYERELEKRLKKNGCEYISCRHCEHLGDGRRCGHYEETVSMAAAEGCGHYFNADKNRLVLRYAEGETIDLPILHTDPKVAFDPADILHIAETLIPSVAEDVKEMISWCEGDRADGENFFIEVLHEWDVEK